MSSSCKDSTGCHDCKNKSFIEIGIFPPRIRIGNLPGYLITFILLILLIFFISVYDQELRSVVETLFIQYSE